MTTGTHRAAALDGAPPAPSAEHRHLPSWVRAGWPVVGGIALVALAARLIGLSTAYDVFIDEPFYTLMGSSIASGHFPPINAGQPFLLHPPGLFIAEAAAWVVLPDDGDLYGKVMLMRGLQQVFATVSAVLLFLLVRQAAGGGTAARGAALVAMVLFTVDPFVLRQNGRVLLETVTVMFVLGGYLLLTATATAAAARRRPLAVGAGLLFGAAILTKDMAVLLCLLPLAVLWGTRWCVRRSDAATAGAVAVGAYGLYVVLVLATGNGAAFWQAKAGGLARLSGVRVTTGFTTDTAPSMVDVAADRALYYGTSYLVIMSGAVAGLLLMLRPRVPAERIVGLFTASAAVMIGYDVVFGTFEEHFLYFLSVPAIASLVVAALRVRVRARRRWLAAALSVLVLADVATWSQSRLHQDDGQRRAAAWLRQHAPAGSKVAWVTDQTQYTLDGTGLDGVALGTPEDMASRHVTYLLVLGKLVDEGYSFVPASDIDWYKARSTKVFSFTGRSYGEIAIYQTSDPSVW